MQELARLLGAAEVLITRAHSLHQKLSAGRDDRQHDAAAAAVRLSDDVIEQFVSELLEQPLVGVAGAGHGPLGKVIHNLFKTAQKVEHHFKFHCEQKRTCTCMCRLK